MKVLSIFLYMSFILSTAVEWYITKTFNTELPNQAGGG